MALSDLIIDQNSLQESLIENIVSQYIRYDPNQRVVVFLPEKVNELTIAQKIIMYLLALKGWQYLNDTNNISQEAQPKEISEVISENGSTVRSNMQFLLKEGLVQKKPTGYSVSSISINKVQNFLLSKGK